MNGQSVRAGIVRAMGRTNLTLRKYSPEILLAAGLAGGIAAAVIAVKETPKALQLIEEVKEGRKIIEETKEKGKLKNGEPYTEETYNSDIVKFYSQTGYKFIKIYGVALGLGALSIACILASHGIMTRRQAALVAAYNLMAESYAAYRKRVADDYGEEVDKEYYLGIGDKKKGELVGANGDKKKTDLYQLKDEYGRRVSSPYARFFDECSPKWEPDALLNKAFLMASERYFNERLQIWGHVFLNDVYKHLGFEETPEGQVVGWIRDNNNDGTDSGRVGDGFVSFGFFDVDVDAATRGFVNGFERSVLLDFNVDGVMYNLI